MWGPLRLAPIKDANLQLYVDFFQIHQEVSLMNLATIVKIKFRQDNCISRLISTFTDNSRVSLIFSLHFVVGYKSLCLPKSIEGAISVL